MSRLPTARPALVLTAVLALTVGLVARGDGPVFGRVSPEGVNYAPERRTDPLLLLPINVNGRWGYCDRNGTVIIAPQYDWADYFYLARDGTRSGSLSSLWIARVQVFGQIRLLWYEVKRRETSALVKASEYQEVDVDGNNGEPADRVSDGTMVRRSTTPGAQTFTLYRPHRDNPNPQQYNGMLRLVDGMAPVVIDGRCGYINSASKESIAPRYASASIFSDGMAAVSETQGDQTRWGVIDKRGQYRFQDASGEIEALRAPAGGLLAVKVGGKWGFLNKAMRGEVRPAYDEVRDFSNSRAAVREGNEWGYIDRTGKRQAWGFEAAYDYEDFTRWGLPDRYEGEAPSPAALVLQGGKYGYLDTAGRITIEPQFDAALPFFRGVARVSTEDGFGYINRSGKPVWDARQAVRNGIRGYNVSEAGPQQWSGLPGPDGTHGEPAPFEYDVPQRVPLAVP